MSELQKMADRVDEIKIQNAIAEKEGRPMEVPNFWDMFGEWFEIKGDHATLTERGEQAVREMRAAEEAELDRNFRESMTGLMEHAMRAMAIVRS